MERRRLVTMKGDTELATTTKEAGLFELRGRNGQLRRLPSLDVASNQEFLTEFRTWIQADSDGLWRTARKRCLR